MILELNDTRNDCILKESQPVDSGYPPFNRSIEGAYFCACLCLNAGEAGRARMHALKIVRNKELKEIAVEGVPNDVYQTEATIKELQTAFYFMMKCSALLDQECEDFFNATIFKRYLTLPEEEQYEEGGIEGYIYLKQGHFQKRIEMKAQFYKKFYPRKKPYMEMPYLQFSDQYFFGKLYQPEFAKMLVKKDYNVALEMLGHFKQYMERLETEYLFITYNLHFFLYILMLDRLSQMNVVESPMLDEFDRWKANVDWRSDLSWEAT